MKASVRAIVLENILQLAIDVPAAAFDVCRKLPGHRPVASTHVTLVRLDDLGITPKLADLPAPPDELEFALETRLVDTGMKQATYRVCSPASQEALTRYTLACLDALGLPHTALDPARLFHVTLTNLGQGDVRASVGSPWEFGHQVL